MSSSGRWGPVDWPPSVKNSKKILKKKQIITEKLQEIYIITYPSTTNQKITKKIGNNQNKLTTKNMIKVAPFLLRYRSSYSFEQRFKEPWLRRNVDLFTNHHHSWLQEGEKKVEDESEEEEKRRRLKKGCAGEWERDRQRIGGREIERGERETRKIIMKRYHFRVSFKT